MWLGKSLHPTPQNSRSLLSGPALLSKNSNHEESRLMPWGVYFGPSMRISGKATVAYVTKNLFALARWPQYNRSTVESQVRYPADPQLPERCGSNPPGELWSRYCWSTKPDKDGTSFFLPGSTILRGSERGAFCHEPLDLGSVNTSYPCSESFDNSCSQVAADASRCF